MALVNAVGYLVIGNSFKSLMYPCKISNLSVSVMLPVVLIHNEVDVQAVGITADTISEECNCLPPLS